MVVDSLKNIELYKGLSPGIIEGLKSLANVKEDIKLGTYPISDNLKAIVSSYSAVDEFQIGYECHKHVMYIGYPIESLERVKRSSTKGMNVNIPHNEAKDRTFFKGPSVQGTYVYIGNGIFVIMFLKYGHVPQHKVGAKEVIKKIAMKLSI